MLPGGVTNRIVAFQKGTKNQKRMQPKVVWALIPEILNVLHLFIEETSLAKAAVGRLSAHLPFGPEEKGGWVNFTHISRHVSGHQSLQRDDSEGGWKPSERSSAVTHTFLTSIMKETCSQHDRKRSVEDAYQPQRKGLREWTDGCKTGRKVKWCLIGDMICVLWTVWKLLMEMKYTHRDLFAAGTPSTKK